jgi:hypothetical protein
LYLLAGLAGLGLVALWLAALHAFGQVAGPVQAAFAATLIEAGLVIEALMVMRRPRLWYVWVGPAISIAVSATYNYLQAGANAPTLSAWPLLTLAVGPLSALLFVAVTLGHGLGEHQAAVEQWQRDRAGWLAATAAEAEAYRRAQEEQRQARLHQLQAAERQRQAEQEAYRRQVEQDEREYRRKQDELARRREERQQRQAEAPPERPADVPQPVERSAEFDELLTVIHERSAQSGQVRFGQADVQRWTGRKRTTAYAVLTYGRQLGLVRQLGRGTYTYKNGVKADDPT